MNFEGDIISKPNRKRYKLEQIREAKQVNGSATIPFEVGGLDFDLPAPGFWPDAAHLAAKEGNSIGLAKALLGEQHELFIEAGGQSDDVVLLMAQWSEDEQGVSLGESSAS
ncbi:hypothetical protein Lfu02_54930 [Longispora fulva]|uniref:Uncharacterized protein n=1 Tax=Longispora fulva TaxID=619741 RepID=A0A8J7GJ23_9ACTN|nr:hypothetical protein [Longispora fulva]MBG6137525.1 hypothetical protein [Longispora fulva]GIG61121.1 hypothetical protein Lfu02_54930 [Longispora fulva]